MTVTPEILREELQRFQAAVSTTLCSLSEEIARLTSALAAGHQVEKSRVQPLTLNDAINEFRTEHAAIGRRSNSWESHAKEFLRFWDGETPLREVMKVPSVSRFIAGLREAGNAPATIQNKLLCLRNFCRLSTEAGQPIIFPRRLAAAIKVHNERTRVLSAAERRALQREMSPENWDIVTIALKTGLRSQELFNLRVADADFDKGTIYIRETKTDRPRTVPMVGEVRAIIARAARARREYVVLPKGYENRKNRSAMTEHWKQEVWRPALKRAGIEDFHFHDLRHVCCTSMIEAGADPVSVAKIMGWQSTQFLMRYSNLGMATLAKAASKA